MMIPTSSRLHKDSALGTQTGNIPIYNPGNSPVTRIAKIQDIDKAKMKGK